MYMYFGSGSHLGGITFGILGFISHKCGLTYLLLFPLGVDGLA
jgi:hypothetical protein